MIKWIRLEAGEYESDDERFYILKSYNRIYGEHWSLRDRQDPDSYKGTYVEETLLNCKLRAEEIIMSEKGGTKHDEIMD